jgi:class 3 adenylate cyclase
MAAPPLVARLAALGADAADSPEDRLRKQVLVTGAVGVGLLASVWVCMYAAFGLWSSAAIPFTHQCLVVVLLGWFARTRRLAAARTALLGMWLVLPFALQWSLGGFVASGIVMAWAVAAPFVSIIFHGARASLPWFAAFLALTVASGIADPWLAHHTATFSEPMRLLFTVMNVAGVAAVTFVLLQYAVRQREAMQTALQVEHELLQAEREKSERLLVNILPAPIAERLKRSDAAIADAFGEVTILFSDIVDFTKLSARISPAELVAFLNQIFSRLDELAERHGIEKIKTIGDAYMAAAGLPTPRSDHADAAAEMALDMRDSFAQLKGPDGSPVKLRIGMNSGPVVAGVIGRRKFSYDLWGDAVNLASRMESHGVAGEIQVSEETHRLLRDRYLFESRGTLQIKGKGELRTWLLTGRKPAGKSTAPEPPPPAPEAQPSAE